MMRKPRSIIGILKHPLIIITILIAITYLIVHVSDLPHKYKDSDAWLLSFVVFFKLGAALFMFVRTRWRDWTILGTGLCVGFLAIGSLYLLTVITYYRGPVNHTEDLVSLIRSMLLMSGVFIITGMTQEWWIDGNYRMKYVKYLIVSSPKRITGKFSKRKE
jgi:hypothetical protein